MTNIGIIGGGAWGTALAQVAASGGGAVTLWARETDVVASINSAHENTAFLKGIALSPAIRATSDMAELGSAALLLVVAPAQHVRSVMADLAPHLHRSTPLILCAKGIEQATGLLVGEIVASVAPAQQVAVLSGPTFAHEVARGLPTAITLACADEALGRQLVATLGQPTFRPYWSPDVVGAEIGGAVKNVLAIACGIAAGRGLGENAKASIITRGFAELLRFGAAKGAAPETLMGLCGLGDLILTCGSAQSRNMSLGMALGQGQSAADALSGKTTVAEGAATAPVLARIAADMGVDMPICQAVAAILAGADVTETITALLTRPFRDEARA
jgi:glycerol-3-phosphate dehydrogenase (NAD(P)+)